MWNFPYVELPLCGTSVVSDLCSLDSVSSDFFSLWSSVLEGSFDLLVQSSQRASAQSASTVIPMSLLTD